MRSPNCPSASQRATTWPSAAYSCLPRLLEAQAERAPQALAIGGLETVVASIYGELLGIDQVGANDNFFALGGDSLRATQVLARISSGFQVNLPILTVFRKPTVAELADEIARSLKAIDQTSVAEILAELKTLSDEDAQRLLAAELRRDPSAK